MRLQAHNLKVVSSNLAPATNFKPSISTMISGVFCNPVVTFCVCVVAISI